MTITTERNDAELKVVVDGAIDTSTAPDFEKVLRENLPGVESLILDFEKVGYVSSAGLRVLLGAAKTLEEAGGSLVVKNVGENVMDVLRVTGFDEVLTIE